MLLKGGPALSVAQFEDYKPTTSLGLSLTITGPTGLYHPDNILNLGSDRWSFKPEIALSHPFGPAQRSEIDAYANVYFYTGNTSYHGTEILRQQPLPGVEGHISHSLLTTSGSLLIRVTLFADLRSSTVSLRAIHNGISSWGVK